MDCNLDNVPTIVAACCVLHNVCERSGDGFDPNWMAADEPAQIVERHIHDNVVANDIRDTIMNYLNA
jgi:hypothetical protein